MLLLHLSDIHFKSPDCLDPFLDPDQAIRTRMIRDLTAQVARLGDVGAILVGGDIAFKAAPEEYHTARTWLEHLAQVSGCPKERIFTVPGNHDVDRSIVRNNLVTQNAQSAIAAALLEKREQALRRQLFDNESGQALFRPYAAYNDFAAPFNCQIWPQKPFWHQDVELDGGVTLRLYGLTSTLLSGQNGQDDIRGSLYLSPLQTVLDPIPNTINLVLAHHPIDWLADGDAVEDALTSRAVLQLFGHKHRQRAIMDASWVRLGAGAVNPSRAEAPYSPGYNLIRLEVEGDGPDRLVRVEVYQRTLQENPERFVPIYTSQGGEAFVSTIPAPTEAEFALVPMSRAGPVETIAIDERTDDVEAAMGNEHQRDLLYRFWALTSGARREIATELGLLEPGEIQLPEPERYGRALIRAAQRNLLDQVAFEVERREN